MTPAHRRTGARQTGKTTLSKSAYPDLRYINLDAPENRDALKEISTSSWGRDVGNAVIDEAQKALVVFEKVKYSFDAGNVSFYVLTGSSQILLLKKIRETLAGFRGEPTGDLYETFVVGEFFQWMKTVQRTGELYFYRTRSGLEVDLLLETQQNIIGMEIKSREDGHGCRFTASAGRGGRSGQPMAGRPHHLPRK